MTQQRDKETLWPREYTLDPAEVDFQHHWVNHQPDEVRDWRVDVGVFHEFEPAVAPGDHRKKLVRGDTNYHAKEHPKRQIALEKVEPPWRRCRTDDIERCSF